MRFHVCTFRYQLWISNNMPLKATRRARVSYKRLCQSNYCSNYREVHSYITTGTLSETHFDAVKTNGTNKSIVFFNSQITKHGRNGDIRGAESVFFRMPNRNTISWTAMLTAYAENGDIGNARKMFDEMPERNTASYNAMITAYFRNKFMIDEAFELFSGMSERNAVSYAAMVTGFVQAGMFDKAEKLYFETPVELRDPVCSNALMSGYLKLGRLEEAFCIFDGMLVRDVVSWSSMVDGYCKVGRVDGARFLFDKMPDRNVVSWTTMIDGYIKDGNFEEGYKLFLKMRRDGVEVNPVTLTVMFEGCGSFSKHKEGIQIHGLVARMGLEFEVFLGNSIIIMYCRFGCINAATKMFRTMSKRDLVSWNSLISGYVQCAEMEAAFEVFDRMPQKDVVSWTTMISGFFSKGLTEKAVQLFGMMPQKDSVSWTAIISGFVNNEEYEEAFRWFTEMLGTAIRLNPITLSSMLSASAGLATLNQGLQIHALAIKMDMEFDLSIQNSLVSMYSKCGNLADAWQVFINIDSPNAVSFNSMITGFAQNGLAKESLSLFRKMQNEGCKPNQITFLGVLSACVHVGFVDEGWKYFKTMVSLYNIEAGPDHYACMVDLLGRAGLLDEAMELIQSMPFEPNPGVWGALLGASRTHLRLDLAELAAQQLIKLEPDNATPYVVLSNLRSVSGKKKDSDQLRMTKKLKGIKKSPGCSWIIVKDKVHLFLAGDQSHTEIKNIKVVLSMIMMDTRQTAL
ncbi:Tetratricopeptide-like helical domain containing protein [Trema orientale]|uniref:Tetratricopeptide-like helical domain containing protein n=1 Tax=Trema orientale TaxID=63057 RepID=A0A2P5CGV6_TREOI|nr:Tetratricopeptide-like helical domain containing protein [Trema orientale]